MLGRVRVSGSSVLKWSVGNPNSWSRRVVTPFLSWGFFARCVIQWSRAPVKHNGSSRVERKCLMVRNLWKELYSEKCLALAEVDFCFFLRRGYVRTYCTVCLSECVALAATGRNYRRHFYCSTEKLSSLGLLTWKPTESLLWSWGWK